MQTFAPYADIEKTFRALDWRRLGKQRVETKQILKRLFKNAPTRTPDFYADRLVVESEFEALLSVLDIGKGWSNHPAVQQWVGHTGALAVYHDLSILEWKRRGYTNNMPFLAKPGRHLLPRWWGDDRFHSSHRSQLLGKDWDYYSQHGWTEERGLPYFWPSQQS